MTHTDQQKRQLSRTRPYTACVKRSAWPCQAATTSAAMPAYGAGGSVGRDDGCDCFRALDDGGATGCEFAGVGLVVAGQVECDDPVTGFDQRLDEDSEVWATFAPAVHQVYRRSVAPELADDPMSAPRCF
jgi:hypothetical protein